MWRRSAGGNVEVLLAHFGGPYWARRDEGAWGIPKGLIEPGETPEQAARREFHEEMGTPVSTPLLPLMQVRQAGGKLVDVFAAEGEFDCAALVSNSFAIEWPPRSGQMQQHPEVDRAAWFDLPTAAVKILPSQLPVLDRLTQDIVPGAAP